MGIHIHLLDGVETIVTAHAGHDHVKNNDINFVLMLPIVRQRLLTVTNGVHAVSQRCQQFLNSLPDQKLIINKQQTDVIAGGCFTLRLGFFSRLLTR